jgi:phage shock protein A
MLFSSAALEARISEVTDRLQRLERDHAQLIARIEGASALRRVVAAANEAAQTGAIVGAAIEGFASAMRQPLKRGRAGGLARASQGYRDLANDGRTAAI